MECLKIASTALGWMQGRCNLQMGDSTIVTCMSYMRAWVDFENGDSTCSSLCERLEQRWNKVNFNCPMFDVGDRAKNVHVSIFWQNCWGAISTVFLLLAFLIHDYINIEQAIGLEFSWRLFLRLIGLGPVWLKASFRESFEDLNLSNWRIV